MNSSRPAALSLALALGTLAASPRDAAAQSQPGPSTQPANPQGDPTSGPRPPTEDTVQMQMPGESAPQPVATQQPQSVTYQQPQPGGYQQPQPAAPQQLQQPQQPWETVQRDGFRLRGGVSLGGGPIIPFGNGNLASVGGLGGISVRFGAQFSHLFGVYLQSQNTLGGLAILNDRGEATGVLLAQTFNSVLASFTLFHMLEFAVGPSLDYVGFAGCAATVSMQACASGAGTGFGLHGRAALSLGGLIGGGPRRVGFNISGDLHPVFFVAQGGGYVTATLSLGVEFH